MAGNSCIWRATTENGSHQGTEANAGTDKIEFNGGIVPDGSDLSHVKSSEVSLETGIAENDKPFGIINELQDTKATRTTIKIIGIIDRPSASLAPQKFKIWQLEDKINAVFTKGRFGLRMDDFPAFNLTPTSVAGGTPRGYMVSNITITRDIEFNRLSFSCDLRFNGDPGTNPYSW